MGEVALMAVRRLTRSSGWTGGLLKSCKPPAVVLGRTPAYMTALIATPLDWMHVLPVNEHGRRALTFAVAKKVVALDAGGWYVAPFSLGWTVGKSTGRTDRDRYFHVVKQDGEPLFFDSADAAHTFLRMELKVTRAAVLNRAGE